MNQYTYFFQEFKISQFTSSTNLSLRLIILRYILLEYLLGAGESGFLSVDRRTIKRNHSRGILSIRSNAVEKLSIPSVPTQRPCAFFSPCAFFKRSFPDPTASPSPRKRLRKIIELPLPREQRLANIVPTALIRLYVVYSCLKIRMLRSPSKFPSTIHQFMRGQNTQRIADLLDLWIRHPAGPSEHDSKYMFVSSQEKPFRDINPVQPVALVTKHYSRYLTRLWTIFESCILVQPECTTTARQEGSNTSFDTFALNPGFQVHQQHHNQVLVWFTR